MTVLLDVDKNIDEYVDLMIMFTKEENSDEYLNDIPKYMCLNCPFQIYPIVKTKIKNKIPKCKEVKITEEILKSKQIKLINIPESEINFEKQNIEVFLLLDKNIIVEEEGNKQKENLIEEEIFENKSFDEKL